MMGLWADGELAGSRVRRGARPSGGPHATGGVKLDANHEIAGDIVSRPLVDAGVPLGTVSLLGVPI
jgi:hypothetical protein